ncbi:LysE family translocator [Vineibacter terrae]|uniref:LysE family translocator n=1 Tax=Vineibacter terrae TaxID=2586908 RepID=UPI002E34CA8F|nr:LysE family translocator [Vineibacter terrae]HEX2886556.1 LysE family translocator [Vineibacter terrae]
MGEGILMGPLVLFAAATCLTPGPNVIMVTASAVNFGFRRTIPQMLGITLGFALAIMAAGIGLAGVLQAEPRLHLALKYVGAAYLLWLAWRIACADSAGNADARSRPISFIEAVLFTWANPKGWATALGALTAYTRVGADLLLQTTTIAGVLAGACLASVAAWAAFGATIAGLLTGRRARTVFNGVMAGLLAASLVPVFW